MALVKCGEKYHIKFVIADAGDAGYDSGVFIEKSKFKTPSNCGSSSIDVTIPSHQLKQLLHIYNLLGQEVNVSQTLNGGVVK